jgi:hypothetical protein
MKEYNNMLYEKYLFYYYNSLVINYSQRDLPKAIEILNEARESQTIKKLPSYIVFIYANLGVLNFDNKDFKQALKNFVRLCMEPGFKNLDIGLRLKINVAELMTRYELGDFDFLEHKLEQVKKDFNALLNKTEFSRQQKMIDIIHSMISADQSKKSKILVSSIHKLLNAKKSEEQAQSDLINYNLWLRSKIT